MAQIFVSHSSKDRDIVSFFSNCCAGTKVRFVYEEFEKTLGVDVSADQIKIDIQQSNAVFVLLSKNVERLPHTRDWVVWESGVSANKNKDIWVFEPLTDIGHISVVMPSISHYVVYLPVDDWMPYVREIIQSYDDSHVLPTIALGAGLGALVGKGEGAALGALAGAALSSQSAQTRPVGVQTSCAICRSLYTVHLPRDVRHFRCPTCNAALCFEATPEYIP